MSRPLAVLRPEPGNAATARRIEALGLGLVAIRLPLFAVHPLDWALPDLSAIDALLVTSANAIRHGGPELAALRHLPVVAVGAASARAAEAAGFVVGAVGTAGAEDAVARAGGARLLHIAGRDLAQDFGLATVTVYASDAVPVDGRVLIDSVALVHSARAARRLSEVAPDRSRIAVAAISSEVAVAAGDGWRAIGIAEQPTDAALIATAQALND